MKTKTLMVIFLKSLVDEVAVEEILLLGESLTCGGKTTHGEADMMIVQAMHGCLNKYRWVYMFGEDTDVFLLLIHFMHKWQIAGLKYIISYYAGVPEYYTLPTYHIMIRGQRYLPLHEFMSILGDRCGKLISMHVLTGCDTVNSVYGVSKPKAHKKLGHEILAAVKDFNAQ